MDIKGYVLYYKDDYNRKHVTFVKTFQDVKFYQTRFGSNNVSIETSPYLKEIIAKQRGNGLYREVS